MAARRDDKIIWRFPDGTERALAEDLDPYCEERGIDASAVVFVGFSWQRVRRPELAAGRHQFSRR